MFAGCEFTCKNQQCIHHNKSISLTGPWPMGDIEKVIQSEQVKKTPDLQEYLKRQAKEGKQFACINLPDYDNIPVLKYRYQYFCQHCLIIHEDIMDYNNEANNNKILFCSSCKEKTLSFQDCLDEGLFCPNCKNKLTQKRWFSQNNKNADGEQDNE